MMEMTESTSTITLYILLKSFKEIVFWLEIFHALSQPVEGIRKIKKILLRYFSDIMNEYGKDRQCNRHL